MSAYTFWREYYFPVLYMEAIFMVQFINDFLKKSNIRGFLFVSILGTLLHFTYEWSGQNPMIGLFSAISESIWEHLKLLFFPMIIFIIIEYKKYGASSRDLLAARTLGLFCGLAFIPVSFYTYTGIIGKSFTVLDIAIFFVSAFLTFYISTKLLQKPLRVTSLTAVILLCVLTALFFLFTFNPPHIQLFLDPVTFRYGI